MPDLAAWEKKLRTFEALSENEMKQLCRLATEILIEESNVRCVPAPAVICGDIHGQFADLLEIFRLAGEMGETSQNYVFLGDLVDRGYNSIETLSMLLVLKCRYPDKITLIRGNHETRQVTSIYGFYDECVRKYGGPDIWRMCTEVFDCFPCAAVVDGTNFCVHGGLSPDLRSIEQMRLFDRNIEIPTEGPFSDLVWSDPENVDTWVVSPRGAGWYYGAKVAREFSHINGLSLIARAHQIAHEGYKYHFGEERVATVWSAPNYCYRCGNLASFLKLYEDQSREFTIFQEVDTQVPEPPATARPAYFL